MFQHLIRSAGTQGYGHHHSQGRITGGTVGLLTERGENGVGAELCQALLGEGIFPTEAVVTEAEGDIEARRLPVESACDFLLWVIMEAKGDNLGKEGTSVCVGGSFGFCAGQHSADPA